MASGNVNVIVPQQANPTNPAQQQPQLITSMSPEGYKVYERLVDSDTLYLREMTRYLYNADLVRTEGIIDPESPIAGYTLVKVGGDEWAPNINLKGYKTLTDATLFFMNEALSTTETDSSRFDLERFCVNATMAIIDMLVANRKKWEFTDPMIIKPLGMAIWRNMVAIGNRSHYGGKMMKMMFHPAVFGGSQGMSMEKPKSKWLP